MIRQRVLWPDVDHSEIEAGWTPLAGIPKGGGITAADVLDVLAARHDEGGWNGRPGRWVFLREVPAATGSYGDVQRFDALALGLVPSVKYARIVYEVKVSRSDWLRELKPRTRREWNGRWGSDSGYDDVVLGPKWAAAMSVATEFWYAAPVRCILPAELPEGAGLLEVRPWGSAGTLRARQVVPATALETTTPGPGFWASVLRHVAARSRGAS